MRHHELGQCDGEWVLQGVSRFSSSETQVCSRASDGLWSSRAFVSGEKKLVKACLRSHI
jgi:hypothetical protein